MSYYIPAGSSIFGHAPELPDHPAFIKHSFRLLGEAWKLAKVSDTASKLGFMEYRLRRMALNPYHTRVEAVKLRRTYVTQGIEVPEWLEELTK